MVTIVPPRLLNLAGLPGEASEPHIREGNHLRVAHNPLLGLPVAPFVLQRVNLDQLPDNFAHRRDIVFRDASNRVLTLPITVQKGDEIRATIVYGPALTCIYVGMATAAIPKPTRVPIDTRRPPRLIATPTRNPAATAAVAAPNAELMRSMLARVLSTTGTVATTESGDLLMRVYSPSIGYGAALLGERSAAPYAFGAPAIAEVVITGRGIITDMAWLAAQDTAKFDWRTIDVLNLPHAEGRRYLSVTDARQRCEVKMRGQAPKRRPLQETSGAIAPSAAAAFSDNEESDRIHTLSAPLDRDLDELIDGAQQPLQATETIPVTDAAGNPLATGGNDNECDIDISHLGRVLQATLDPGVAAWLGYKGLDPKGAKQGLSFYRVVGFFRHPLAIGADPQTLIDLPFGAIPANERQMTAPVVFRTVESLAGSLLAQEGRSLLGQLEAASDYMMMAAVAAVDGRAAPDAPAPPTLMTPGHVSWLPAVPPAAVREVDCPLKDVLIGATLAAEREQPIPGGYAPLNRLVGASAWHIPLTLGLNTANDGQLISEQAGRQGVIADRAAGPAAARYHIAQQDRFGRWSAFAANEAAPGPRPKPPRPVVQGTYAMPSIADAATQGGVFRLSVPLPEPESLAPGSFPLSHVRLSFKHHSINTPAVGVAMPDVDAAIATAIDIDVPPPGEAPRRAVPVTTNGPILQPTEQRRMVITAVWIDTAGQVSVPSEPLRLAMTDPRPPAQMPISDVLLYSSRPDATGLAWIERAWPVPASNSQTYAAYYTDEIRLVSWLKSQGRATEANDIAATTDRAARAGKLRAIQSDFPDHLFERLAGAIDTSVTGQRRLRHAVSGSSRVLNAYKIAVEAAASGARPNLSGLDIVFYGVPNSDPPPRPSVAVKPVTPTVGEPILVIEVTVAVEPGVTRAERARIYRTRGGPADPLHAPLIATVTLSAPDPETGRQTATLRDVGTAQIAPTAVLSAFSPYQWFAEVQGAPESGSSVPGLWSRPSDPAGATTIPLNAPAAPTFDGFDGASVTGGMQDLAIKLSHPLGLQPTPIGAWKVEVLRAEPGEDWSKMVAGDILETPVVIADPTHGGFTPLATQYRITLFDPTGRPSPSLEVTN
jgi:hypothetical protein